MRSRQKDFIPGCEPSDPEIVTVPDCSLSIPELLKKFSRGVVPDIAKEPIFEDGDISDDILCAMSDLDFDRLDAYELGLELKQRISHFKAQNNGSEIQPASDIKKDDEVA